MRKTSSDRLPQKEQLLSAMDDVPKLGRRERRALMKSVSHYVVGLGRKFPESLPVRYGGSVLGPRYRGYGLVASQLLYDLFNGFEFFKHAPL